jgi:hypothetical protein
MNLKKISLIFFILICFTSSAHANLVNKAYRSSIKNYKKKVPKFFKCAVGRKEERQLHTKFYKEAVAIYGPHGHDTWKAINKYVFDNVDNYHRARRGLAAQKKPHNRKAEILIKRGGSQPDFVSKTTYNRRSNFQRVTFQSMASTGGANKRNNPGSVRLNFGTSSPHL